MNKLRTIHNDILKSPILNKQKKQDLNLARNYMLIGNFFLALSSVSMKLVNHVVPNYDIFSFLSIRFLFLTILAYAYLSKTTVSAKEQFQIIKEESKVWFAVRVLSSILGVITFSLSLKYIKLGTTSCISLIFPLLVSIFSYYLLRERFSLASMFGSFACFFGTILISINENYQSVDGEPVINTYLKLFGLLMALLNAFLTCFIIISSKVLIKILNNSALNYLTGLFCALVLCFFSLFTGLKDYANIWIWVLGSLNGILYYYSFDFFNRSLELADTQQMTFAFYSNLAFVIIMGYLLFGETFGIIDSIGVLIILSSNIIITHFKL